MVSSGPDRIIVYEGAEEKLKQLGTGLLEKLGMGGPSWEQEERERYRLGVVPAENQLPPASPAPRNSSGIQPATSRAFEPPRSSNTWNWRTARREPLRQRRYLDDDRTAAAPRPRPDLPTRALWERVLGRSLRDQRSMTRAHCGRDTRARTTGRQRRRPFCRGSLRLQLRTGAPRAGSLPRLPRWHPPPPHVDARATGTAPRDGPRPGGVERSDHDPW